MVLVVNWERDNLVNFLVELRNAQEYGGIVWHEWNGLAADLILNWFRAAEEKSYAN